MSQKKNASRTAPKFVVRLREGQRERIIERAAAEHRAMNDICTRAIDRYLDQQEAFDQVLVQLQNSMVTKTEHLAMVASAGADKANLLELARLVLEGDPGAHALAAGVAKTGVA